MKDCDCDCKAEDDQIEFLSSLNQALKAELIASRNELKLLQKSYRRIEVAVFIVFIFYALLFVKIFIK